MLAFDSPKDQSSIIKVIGVGGGGGNAVNHMYNQGIKGVDFILCNTDSQALDNSSIPTKLQLGSELTEGRGAGSKPEVGRNAAVEDTEKIKELLANNTKMLFITAGMGGGTGTGAAPIIAQIAADLDILTVGIVTIPFQFEGRKRQKLAEQGILEMKKHVDTILIISNDKLRELHGNLTLSNAFSEADSILTTAAKGIAEIITVTGYINVDFEDVKTVMKKSGAAIMGAGSAEGENRALDAAEMALNSPLLNDNDIKGANDMLLYIATGVEKEIEMDEVSEITDYITDHAGEQCDVIWGSGTDENLGNKISITLIATGFHKEEKKHILETPPAKVFDLDGNLRPKNHNAPKRTPIPEHKTISHAEQRTKETALENTTVKPSTVQAIQEETNEITLITKDKTTTEPIKTTPILKTEIKEVQPMKEEDKLSERTQKLKAMSYTPKGSSFNEMEDVPAYKRKNVHISHTVVSQESEVSRFSLNDDGNTTELKSNNSFLHDNVD